MQCHPTAGWYLALAPTPGPDGILRQLDQPINTHTALAADGPRAAGVTYVPYPSPERARAGTLAFGPPPAPVVVAAGGRDMSRRLLFVGQYPRLLPPAVLEWAVDELLLAPGAVEKFYPVKPSWGKLKLRLSADADRLVSRHVLCLFDVCGVWFARTPPACAALESYIERDMVTDTRASHRATVFTPFHSKPASPPNLTPELRGHEAVLPAPAPAPAQAPLQSPASDAPLQILGTVTLQPHMAPQVQRHAPPHDLVPMVRLSALVPPLPLHPSPGVTPTGAQGLAALPHHPAPTMAPLPHHHVPLHAPPATLAALGSQLPHGVVMPAPAPQGSPPAVPPLPGAPFLGMLPGGPLPPHP